MLLILGAVCVSAEARKVSGSVVSGDEKLSGVIVTPISLRPRRTASSLSI